VNLAKIALIAPHIGQESSIHAFVQPFKHLSATAAFPIQSNTKAVKKGAMKKDEAAK
jgi:hypothetical protein